MESIIRVPDSLHIGSLKRTLSITERQVASGGFLLAAERRDLILERVKRDGRVESAALAEEFDTAEITIRRDLNHLHVGGFLSRVHGGAVRRGQHGRPPSDVLTIGVIVPAREYYYSEVVQGASSVAESFRSRLVLGVAAHMSPHGNPVAHMVASGVDGLLVTPPVADAEGAGMSEWLSDVAVPLVLMERAYGFPNLREFDHVRSDHARGSELALEHFHRLGHSGVAVAVAETATAPQLLEGVTRASQVLHFPGGMPRFALPKEDDPDLPGVLTAMLDDCLARGIHAFFVHTDMQASLFVDIARTRGLLVPGDVSVIAYDDVVAPLASIPLTAVAPPKRKIGAVAMELLDRRLRSPDPEDTVAHITLSPTLHVRSSCGGSQTHT